MLVISLKKPEVVKSEYTKPSFNVVWKMFIDDGLTYDQFWNDLTSNSFAITYNTTTTTGLNASTIITTT